MDYKQLQLPVILGLCVLLFVSANDQNDSAIILTGIPYYFTGLKHLTAIQVSPRDLENHTESNPGLDIGDSSALLVSCDTDYDNHYLYYYDYGNREIALLENFTVEMVLATMNQSTFQGAASKGFTMIAVDWINHNVYWSEPIMGRIVVKKGGKNNDITAHHVVISDLKRPRGVAVDPVAGYLFWTDIQSRLIGRSSLIGANRINLVYSRLHWPVSIVLDTTEKKLYWTDTDSIYSATYDGTSRQHFYRYSYAYFYDIALFDDVIVATDVERYFAFFIDKTTGKEVAPREKSSTEAYYGVCTYQNRTREPPAEDRCAGYGCQDICVDEPGKPRPTCLCKDGFLLKGDFKSCHAFGYPYHRGIVLNTGRQLCIVSIQILSDHKDQTPVCFYTAPGNKTISWFDLNMKLRLVYFSMGTNIYSIDIDGVYDKATVVTKQNYEIFSLTYDWMDDLIYYSMTTTSQQPESIWRVDPRTGSTVPSQMMTGESPRAIAISPHEQKVFWITGGMTVDRQDMAKIEYTDLSLKATADINYINTTIDLSNVTRMYHDVKSESLYLLESEYGFDHVKQIEYDGTNSNYLNVKDGISDFAVYKDYILLGLPVGDTEITLETWDKNSAPLMDTVASGKLKGIENLVGIKVFDKEVLQPTYPDPCGSTKKKGGCEHICLPEGKKAKCSCNLGYTLINNKECKSYPVEDNFLLVSDITYHEIFQIPLDDPTNLIGIKTPYLGVPSGVLYNYDKKIVTWASDDYRQIWGMFLNGSTDFMISELDNFYKIPDRFAYDPSSQLLYYSAYSTFPINGYSGFIGVIDKDGRETTLHGLAENPRAIVLHPRKGLLFYTDHGAPGIYRMEMDGSNWTTLISENITWPNGLAIDYDADLLYWSDGYLDTIYSCDYNGGGRITIFEDKGAHMMALKLLDGYLYYSAWDKSKITMVKITDTSDISLIGPEHSLGRVHDMDIYVSGKTDKIPQNLECSVNNGGCSHFCLPNQKGHACGCESGYSILNDLKTCENVPRCPAYLIAGEATDSDTCLRLGGNVCGFTCMKNYKPKAGVATITCTTEPDPDFPDFLLRWDVEEPCEEILCPMSIQHGRLNTSCDGKVGSDCVDYTCMDGYEKNVDITSLVCQDHGLWANAGPLCIAKCSKLTSMENHAVLHPSCTRDVGKSCKFICDDGYISAVTNDRIQCQTGSQWNITVDTLCEEIMCNDYIEGGVINEICSLKLGSVCEYDCDFRFLPNPDIPNITCIGQGDWSHGETQNDLLCTEEPVKSAASKSDKKVAIGVGVAVGVIVIAIIIVLLIIYLYRAGRLPGKKAPPASNTTSFENPRYVGDNVNIQPTGRNNAYATLEDDKVDLTKDSWRKTQELRMKTAPEHVYDNPMSS